MAEKNPKKKFAPSAKKQFSKKTPMAFFSFFLKKNFFFKKNGLQKNGLPAMEVTPWLLSMGLP